MNPHTGTGANPVTDDGLVEAYVDDELTLDDRQRVEAAMAADPGLRTREQAIRALDASLRDALRPAMELPMPELHVPRDSAPLARSRTAAWLGLGGAGGTWRPAFAASIAALAVFAAGGLAGALLTGGAGGEGAEAPRAAALRAHAFERALETEVSGDSLRWEDQGGVRWGEVTPVRTYKNRSGQYCRDFEESRWEAGVETVDYGVACREPGGGWKVRVRYYP